MKIYNVDGLYNHDNDVHVYLSILLFGDDQLQVQIGDDMNEAFLNSKDSKI